jgi:hypothetical protein
MVAGGEAAWRAMPFVSLSNCFVVPPMKFATESCLTMEACIRAGMPILLLSAGQAGATAPAPIASAIVQAVAECLAGSSMSTPWRPGHPAVFGTWPFVSDLRTGAMSGGSAEQALLVGGLRPDAQVLRHPRRRGGRHERQQGARHAGRVGTGDHQRALRSVGAQHDLRVRGHVRLAHGVLAGGHGAGQRPDRTGAALRAWHRRDRGRAVARRDEGGLPRWRARALPRLRPDARA